MKEYYCWRCKKIMPFLEEREWKQVDPLISDVTRAIKDYRAEHGCDIKTAIANIPDVASARFETLTGMPGVKAAVIHHHRLSAWGRECPRCGHLLRARNANICANCAWRPGDTQTASG